jgi:hypothetical protein
MVKVVQLNERRREPDVWQCQCGCYTFWLYSDRSAHCSACGDEAVSMGGFWRIPTGTIRSEYAGQIVTLPLRPADR